MLIPKGEQHLIDTLVRRTRYEVIKEEIHAKNAKYYASNREELCQKEKDRRINNPEVYKTRDKSKYEKNREKRLAQEAAKYATNRKEMIAKQKARDQAKKDAGYRYRKDPADGKHRWMFVGKEVV